MRTSHSRRRYGGAERRAEIIPAAERLLVTIDGAEQMLGLGRTKVYALLGERKLIGVKVGRRTLVTTASIRELLASLPLAQIAVQKHAM